MSETINLICFECRHFTPHSGGCAAFPGGIPQEILDTNQHSEPLPDQKNSIVYEPLEESK